MIAYTGYRTETATGHVIDYYDLPSPPVGMTGYIYTPCMVKDLPPLYEFPQPLRFNAQTVQGLLLQAFAAKLNTLGMAGTVIVKCVDWIATGDKVAAKQILNDTCVALVQAELFTQEDYDTLKAIMATNGEAI